MGKVETDIMLVNAEDVAYAKGGFIRINEVRKDTVKAIADTGAMSLILTEELFQKLGLTQTGTIDANLADGRKLPCKVTSGVIINWQNRRTLVEAVVIPGATRVLLGAIPLEGMDLMVDPVNNALVGVHGDEIVCMVY
jgi:clan AA aspartic protease